MNNPSNNSAPCPVCGSGDQITLYKDTLGTDLPQFDSAFSPEHMRTYRVVRCNSCSHAFCVLWQNDISGCYNSVIDPEYLTREEAHLLTAKKIVAILLKYMPKGTLLDIGCATGDFLSIAKEYYSVEGLELSTWASEIAQKHGLLIHTNTISELPDERKYDIITLLGVIEHFNSPAKELAKIARIIRPGGYVFVWTGDRDSWLAKIMGRRWWYIQGNHIQYFNKKSLDLLFSDADFSPVAYETYPFTTSLSSLSKSVYRYRFMRPLAKLLLDNKYIGKTVITLRLPGEMLAVYRKDSGST